MSFWRDLVIENPMLIDLKRALRRFFGVSRFGALNAVVLILAILLYALLLLVTVANRAAMTPVIVIMIQTFLFCFLAPAMLHGAIAGEREKRTWDMLMVSPITNLQIVIGKFVGGVAVILGVALLLLPPTAMSFGGDPDATGAGVLKGELISITWGIALCAVTIFVSARSKRAFGAQVGVYVLLLVLLLVWPLLVYAMPTGPDNRETLLAFHPFVAISDSWLASRPFSDNTSASPSLFAGWQQAAIYLASTAFILYWTIHTLNIADDSGRSRGVGASS